MLLHFTLVTLTVVQATKPEVGNVTAAEWTCNAKAQDPSCFTAAFPCAACCETRDAGPGGWARCWGERFTYAGCCPACPAEHDPTCFPAESPHGCAECCDRRLSPRGNLACWTQTTAPLSFERCCLGRALICSTEKQETAEARFQQKWALQTSQYGQDRFVLQWFACLDHGFYVDVGAYDGEHLSNTHAMDKDLGWRGVCVDAVLRPKNFLGRSCHLAQGAVHSKSGKPMRFLKFAQHHESAYGHLVEEEQSPKGHDRVLGEWDAVRVRTISMTDLFRNLQAQGFQIPQVIDFISVDVEGAVLDVLLGFPFRRYCVRAWALEISSPIEHPGSRLLFLKTCELLQHHGYLLVQQLGQDYIFIHQQDCGLL